MLGIAITVEPLPVVGFILVLGSHHARRNGFAFIAAWIASLAAIVAATLLVTGGQPPVAQQRPGAVERHRQHRGRPGAAGGRLAGVEAAPGPAPQAAGLDGAGRPHLGPGLGLARLPAPALGTGGGRGHRRHPGRPAHGRHHRGAGAVLPAGHLQHGHHATDYWISPEAATQRLARLQDWVDRNRDRGIILLSGVIGVALAGKGIYLIASHKAVLLSSPARPVPADRSPAGTSRPPAGIGSSPLSFRSRNRARSGHDPGTGSPARGVGLGFRDPGGAGRVRDGFTRPWARAPVLHPVGARRPGR